MATTTETGARGEDRAAAFLKNKGYRILHRNYRLGRSEVDLVAIHGEFLVIVEVKTRTGQFYEGLSQAIPRTKMNRLVRVADYLAQSLGWQGEVRFDVVCVLRRPCGYSVIHQKNAFYPF